VPLDMALVVNPSFLSFLSLLAPLVPFFALLDALGGGEALSAPCSAPPAWDLPTAPHASDGGGDSGAATLVEELDDDDDDFLTPPLPLAPLEEAEEFLPERPLRSQSWSLERLRIVGMVPPPLVPRVDTFPPLPPDLRARRFASAAILAR